MEPVAGAACAVACATPAALDPLTLADALLAEAERHPDPATLIAAARALLARVARTEGEIPGGGGAKAEPREGREASRATG